MIKKFFLLAVFLVLMAGYTYTQLYVIHNDFAGYDFKCYWLAAELIHQGYSPYKDGMETKVHYYLYTPATAYLVEPLVRTMSFEGGFLVWITLSLLLYSASIYRMVFYSQPVL